MRRIVLAAAATGAVALACSAGTVAQAAPRTVRHPSAAFSFKRDRVNHGVRPVLTYQTSNLPRHPVIYLQRQFGSAHVWGNVERLRALRGTVSAPGVQMGKYSYRIQVRASGRLVVNSRSRPLYSYGPVRLSALCPADGFDCSPQTIQIGTTIFTYVLQGGGTYPSYSADLQLNSTSCDRLSLQFATDDSTGGDDAYVEVIQSRTDPQYGSAPTNTVGKFSAYLDGGPFYLETAESVGWTVYMNGHASCYTPSGTP